MGTYEKKKRVRRPCWEHTIRLLVELWHHVHFDDDGKPLTETTTLLNALAENGLGQVYSWLTKSSNKPGA